MSGPLRLMKSTSSPKSVSVIIEEEKLNRKRGALYRAVFPDMTGIKL